MSICMLTEQLFNTMNHSLLIAFPIVARRSVGGRHAKPSARARTPLQLIRDVEKILSEIQHVSTRQQLHSCLTIMSTISVKVRRACQNPRMPLSIATPMLFRFMRSIICTFFSKKPQKNGIVLNP